MDPFEWGVIKLSGSQFLPRDARKNGQITSPMECDDLSRFRSDARAIAATSRQVAALQKSCDGCLRLTKAVPEPTPTSNCTLSSDE